MLRPHSFTFAIIVALLASVCRIDNAFASDTASPTWPNIVFILCDDHRFDCLGAMGHPFLETPHLDRLAADGCLMTKAYVTTSLCSPSRASILTGQYAHNHRVVDNYHAVDPNLVFFPEVLQAAGYRTAMIGKWHMGGEIDDPQKGFDHWISFKGQGTYWPDGHGTTRRVPQVNNDGFNINGKRVPQRGYITDELTDYAIDWISQQSDQQPFFLYLSHKAVHADFVPADRHRGRYDKKSLPIKIPSVAEMDRGNFPMWVRNQRNSRHGVDFGYNLHGFSPAVYYRRYCESLLAVDDGVGKLRKALNDRNLADNTLIVYMGDNGFQFGDHGLIDKRVAYEASARVPLILAGPGIPAGCRDSDLIGNIDIAPTLLDAAGVTADAWSEKLPGDRQIQFDGVSAWGSIGNASGNGPRSELLYEYYWERNYPHTPTLHAVIGGRYKFIRCHGLWDREEFYDLQQDPCEMQNLMTEPEHAARISEHRTALWKMLSKTGGDAIPLLADEGPVFPARDAAASGPAAFPDEFLVPSQPK